MKLLIVGSRTFTMYEQLKTAILQLYSRAEITEIISGGADGADSLAAAFAREHNIAFTEYPAKWQTFGRRAGILRNINMVNAADAVIAFWDGQSPGTKFTIAYAKEKKKTLNVYRY